MGNQNHRAELAELHRSIRDTQALHDPDVIVTAISKEYVHITGSEGRDHSSTVFITKALTIEIADTSHLKKLLREHIKVELLRRKCAFRLLQNREIRKRARQRITTQKNTMHRSHFPVQQTKNLGKYNPHINKKNLVVRSHLRQLKGGNTIRSHFESPEDSDAARKVLDTLHKGIKTTSYIFKKEGNRENRICSHFGGPQGALWSKFFLKAKTHEAIYRADRSHFRHTGEHNIRSHFCDNKFDKNIYRSHSGEYNIRSHLEENKTIRPPPPPTE